jgi:hypothetical protein
MEIVVYKNDNSGPIKNDVIVINPSELSNVEVILSQLDPSLNAFVIDNSELPEEKYWFNCFEVLDNSRVELNFNKAKESMKNTFRARRGGLLIKLDVAYQRAQETNDTEKLAEIVAKKNKLRDLPTLVDSVNDLEELKIYWFAPVDTYYDLQPFPPIA